MDSLFDVEFQGVCYGAKHLLDVISLGTLKDEFFQHTDACFSIIIVFIPPSCHICPVGECPLSPPRINALKVIRKLSDQKGNLLDKGLCGILYIGHPFPSLFCNRGC